MDQDARDRKRVFPDEFDDAFALGPAPSSAAFFGRNVLRGLVEGIDEFIHRPEERWLRYRPLGPALLGSSMWINDDDLIDKIGELYGACIVVSKRGRRPGEIAKLAPLDELNERTPGMPVQAFSALTELAPKVNGQPAFVGPSTPPYEEPIPTIRTLGFRKERAGDSPPILHTKLALLGRLWWHDEDDLSPVADVMGFQPFRLWVTSANFTTSSRRNLEFGYWTEDAELMAGAERYLIKLMRSSEALDPDSDLFDPDLVPVDYDDEAMQEAWSALQELHADDDQDYEE